MDFSQVKAITIPEGSVKQITDSQGNVLWPSGPSWHTEWEGTKLIQGSSATTGSSYATMWSSSALTETATEGTVRVTLDYNVTWEGTTGSTSSHSIKYYDDTVTQQTINATTAGSTSTGTITTYIKYPASENNNLYVENASTTGVSARGVRLQLMCYTTSGGVSTLSVVGRRWTLGGSAPTTNIIIKKIEQLY